MSNCSLFIVRVLIGAAIALCFDGCQNAHKSFTEDEVRRVVQSGVSKDAVIQYFGKPLWINRSADGTTILVYHLRIDDAPIQLDPSKYMFVGFQVYVRDDKVVKWTPVTRGRTHIFIPGKAESGSAHKYAGQSIRCYIVKKDPISDGEYVNTQEFPQLGYVSGTPDFEMREIEFLAKGSTVSVTNGKERATPTLSIGMTAQDFNRCRTFTKDNIGKQILIRVAEARPVVVTLIEPAVTKVMLLGVSNESEASELLVELRNLVKPKP